MFEQLLRVGEGDVVIGISFPRYSTRSVRALEFARDQGATVVAVTDSELSPLYDTARYRLLAKSDMVSFADSLVAPLSVINALIVAVGRKKSDEVTAIFEKLERIWDEYQVYEKVEYGVQQYGNCGGRRRGRDDGRHHRRRGRGRGAAA